MKINDFPIDINVDLGALTQTVKIEVELASDVEDERVDAVRNTVRHFALSGHLGFFSGGAADPAEAETHLVAGGRSATGLSFTLTLTNIPANCCRVLIGMMRGNVMLDGLVTRVAIYSDSLSPGRKPINTHDEMTLTLPGLCNSLSFEHVTPRSELIRSSDRGVRLSFASVLRPQDIEQLLTIQQTWDAVCEGGCCPEGMQAVECAMFASAGLLTEPSTFEIRVGVFRNPEICFEYLANAMERFSRTTRRVSQMEVW